jgi:pimeloyl-ACP methyl ester carboxylesterase
VLAPCARAADNVPGMSRRLTGAALAASLLAAALAAARVEAAGAALPFTPCENDPAFSCAALAVPLDRSGAVGGSVTLRVERRASGLVPSQSALLPLAGGPGQAVLPLGGFIAKEMAPALESRDLLLFDQRGTGSSDPLSCGALGAPANGSVGALLERCALQIGPARGDYTTQESVADIESLRRAAGYRRLVLYGTSYGTKVALEYAARYPAQVEGLLLDSVVPMNGPEPLGIPSFQAIPAVLRELCSRRACAGITSNALADMARIASLLHTRALRGDAFDGRGHRSAARLREADLLDILQAGDLNPALRALLPSAMRSVLRGDPDPLVRLHLLSLGLIPSVPNVPVESSPPINEALFASTSCEETPFPWQRAGSAATRLAEANAAVRALPSGDFYPFDASTALATDLIPDCAYWPDASPAPAAPGALPAVPTLILSGTQDLRTPSALAAQVAAQIPGARLETVPYTGHSVIGSDFSGCAAAAVSAFFTARTVAPCSASKNTFSPTPVSPTRLAYVPAPPGLRGRPGRTLTAVLDTLIDLSRQVISATLQAEQELPSGSSFGGLRGGYAELSASAARLKRYSFVTGVQLSGTFPVQNGELQPATIAISGSQAAAGSVTFGLHKYVTGTLGGRHFKINLATVRLASASQPTGGEWPARVRGLPLPALVDAHHARLP